jgi:linoleoyl-CoA desaturase
MAHEAALPAGKIRFSQGNRNEFYRTVRRRVRAYFDATGKSRFANATIVAKAIVYGGLSAASYGALLSGGFGRWGSQLLAVAFGVSALLLSIAVAHDAAHDALSRHRWVNRLVQQLCFTLIGADAYLWRLRHVKSHHSFPNVNGCDIDIDSNFWLRLSPNHRQRWHQRFQHFYAPVIFWLVDIDTVFFKDIQYLFRRRLANMTDIRHPAGAYVIFFLSKICYVTIVFVAPLLLLPFPWWSILIGWAVMTFVSSALFVYLLIGTHFAEETAFPEVNGSGAIDHDWATHAMVTSLDWSPQSALATFIAGGANAHAAHHLFPNISHAHYGAITRIIAETAAEFGVTYNVSTLPKMIRSHFRFLRRMARSGGGAGLTSYRRQRILAGAVAAFLATAAPAAADQVAGQLVLVVKTSTAVEIRDERRRVIKHEEETSVEGEQWASLSACLAARDRLAATSDAEEKQRESNARKVMQAVLVMTPETSQWVASASVERSLACMPPAAARAIGWRPAE